jgi:Helix-turn-helix domain
VKTKTKTTTNTKTKTKNIIKIKYENKGDEMTDRKMFPIDARRVDESNPDSGEYRKATAVGRKLRDQILADTLGRKSYEKATADIEIHQASLAQLRKLRSLAQATVADLMDMDQSEISRLEHRSDLLLSTLRRFIQATGGDLHLVAQFPEGNVELLIGDDYSDEVPDSSVVSA